MRRLILLIGLVTIASPQDSAVDPLIWGSFFRQVSQEKAMIQFMAEHPDLAKKLPETIAGLHRVSPPPDIAESANLTTAEAQFLSNVAASCASGLGAIIQEFPRHEVLFQQLEGGLSPELAEQVRTLERRRIKMIEDSVQQLHKTFGDERFNELIAFIQRPENAKRWHPLLPLLEPGTQIKR